MSNRLGTSLLAAFFWAATVTIAAPQQTLEPMSLDLKKIAVESILSTFAQVTGSRLERDPAVSGAITFQFDHLSWETALNAICESAWCAWQLEQHGSERVLRVVPARSAAEESNRITLKVKSASAREVFSVLARIQELELEIDPTVEGEFTFSFDRVTPDTVMDALCENIGCAWSRQVDPAVLTVSRTTTPPISTGSRRRASDSARESAST